jgi:hypothetical protein
MPTDSSVRADTTARGADLSGVEVGGRRRGDESCQRQRGPRRGTRQPRYKERLPLVYGDAKGYRPIRYGSVQTLRNACCTVGELSACQLQLPSDVYSSWTHALIAGWALKSASICVT